MEGHCAFILGYTGETGKALVQELSRQDYFKKIILVGRREVELPVKNDDRFVQKIVDYDDISKYDDVFRGCDVGFCCLGTTAGKAGKDHFYKVDHDYVVNTANVAKSAGCQHFQIVSSDGANKHSRFFYLKTKGQTDDELQGLQFRRLSVFKPKLLLTDRVESRPMEHLIRILSKPVNALFPTLMSVSVEKVAKAMLNNAKKMTTDTVEVFDNTTIHSMANA